MRRKWATLVLAGLALLAFVFHERRQAVAHHAAEQSHELQIAMVEGEHSQQQELAEELSAVAELLREENHDLRAQLAAAKAILDHPDEIEQPDDNPAQAPKPNDLGRNQSKTEGSASSSSEQKSNIEVLRNEFKMLRGSAHCGEGVQSVPRGATSGHRTLMVPPAACRKFVAVVAPVTSHGSKGSDSGSLPATAMRSSHFVLSFFSSAVQSLARSNDAGFDVAFYIGHDAGDAVWDTDVARDQIAHVLQLQVNAIYGNDSQQAPALQDSEIATSEQDLIVANATRIGLFIKMVRCQGKSMVSASNCAISHAFEDGAEYWYRVNDDTVLTTANWVQDFTHALQSFDPPNVGVVGPADDVNNRILTYDFVHRTHWEIFGFQYPRFLRNWWCDDWITYVYGRGRSGRLPTQKVHHILENSRYDVQHHDEYGEKIDQQLNVSYAEAACLIDNHVINTEEYKQANLTDKPALTSNPSGVCMDQSRVRRKVERHRESKLSGGLAQPDAPYLNRKPNEFQADLQARKSGTPRYVPVQTGVNNRHVSADERDERFIRHVRENEDALRQREIALRKRTNERYHGGSSGPQTAEQLLVEHPGFTREQAEKRIREHAAQLTVAEHYNNPDHSTLGTVGSAQRDEAINRINVLKQENAPRHRNHDAGLGPKTLAPSLWSNMHVSKHAKNIMFSHTEKG